MSVFTSAVLQGLNAVASFAEVKYEFVPSYFTCEETALYIGASELVTQRTLYKLAKAQIVQVKRGPGGGFRITEEQLRTKRVLDVLEALGQPCMSPEGSRASDRLQQRFYDSCDLTLEEFFG